MIFMSGIWARSRLASLKYDWLIAFSTGFIDQLQNIVINQEANANAVATIPITSNFIPGIPKKPPTQKIAEKMSISEKSRQTRLVKTNGFLCFFFRLKYPLPANANHATGRVAYIGNGVNSNKKMPKSIILETEE